MNILFPSNTRETIQNIIDTIGREVLFVSATLSGCYNCSLDPITNTSVNSFCPVCSGEYWIKQEMASGITAHVTWKFSELEDWQAGGIVSKGDGIVKIMYSGPYLAAIDSSEYMVVDGREVDIEKVTVLGVPSLNRIVIDFKERIKRDE